jgi:hypothetical protein
MCWSRWRARIMAAFCFSNPVAHCRILELIRKIMRFSEWIYSSVITLQ